MGQVSVSLPSDGQTADVSDYNTPITTIVDEINGNLDNSNISASAAIAGSKLANDSIPATKLGTGATYLGYNDNAGGTLTNAYATRTSVTADSTGSDVIIRTGGWIRNGNSGAIRTVDIKLLCDGDTVKEITGINVAFSGTTDNHDSLSIGYTFKHTPDAGNHTWALQIKASANSAVLISTNFMEVAEVK